jgi:CBS domain-containing protein
MMTTTTTARELMQADVMSVLPETSLLDIHRLFVEEEINGAPVVTDDGDVVGVISSMDLLRAVLDQYSTGASSNAAAYFREASPYSGPDWSSAPEDFQDRLKDLTAADAMCRDLVSVTPATPIGEIARVMRSQHVHRVLVIGDNDLVGILTTFDLLRVLEHTNSVRSSALPRQSGDPVC